MDTQDADRSEGSGSQQWMRWDVCLHRRSLRSCDGGAMMSKVSLRSKPSHHGEADGITKVCQGFSHLIDGGAAWPGVGMRADDGWCSKV